MKKPIIGLVPLMDEKRESYWMLPGYMKAIEYAGGIPIMFPMCTDRDVLEQMVDMVDGILFTGGHDVNPALYKEEMLKFCGVLCNERDEMEEILFRSGLQNNIPMFGICRGIQFFNVMCGGTLYQDLPLQRVSDTLHQQKPPYDQPIHSVHIVEHSPLKDLLGVDTLDVNSYHHQAIKKLGDSLEVMAYSEDGLVEALYMPEKKFVWAVQWHPEFSYLVNESSQKIISKFIEACIG